MQAPRSNVNWYRDGRGGWGGRRLPYRSNPVIPGDPMALERRRFLTYFAGTGVASTLFPGALWAIAQQQQDNRITKEMIQQAELLAGLEFTDEERTAIVNGVN